MLSDAPEDSRIPVSSAGPPARVAADVAVILSPGEAAPAGAIVERLAMGRLGHGAACVCCAPRAALAEALHRLFLRRARGEVRFFRHVVVSMPPDEIDAALADPLVATRFRGTRVRTGEPGRGFCCR